MAGNADVARYLKSFQGLGALSDSSKATPAADALAGFRYPSDLAMDLVLSEPAVTQPVEISFDHRGRLWVVQYNQYPYPKGLKITNVDNYLRVTFDKVPDPPPDAVKGADKITFFEDTDGDGKYDKATDAINGLNIATSVALGRGRIWVLNPPYLLAYPDPDGNGIPDGPPVVHLSGFGIQDTHAVANSLTWGPDGWLYGAQGSTCTSTVSSSVTKNVFLQGQAIWRYNPVSHVFERFAEGGGNNPFNIEIDEKGRIYSGSNGTDRGPDYKQGGYYIKSWGKHGPLSNPYAFGYLPNMAHTGDKKRFTHAFIKYEGGALPERYEGKMIAINPLLNYVQLARFEPEGSSFRNIDEGHILETKDRWFRPVDIQAGPDGAVYLADWCDSRLSHVDPHDTWNKVTGRIYRLRNKDSAAAVPAFDLRAYSNEQLIALLSDKNEWFRRQAILLLGDRKDSTVIPALLRLFGSDNGQTALEALWAINLSGGFNDKIAVEALRHKDPYVRMWGVRLLGDAGKVSPAIAAQLARLAGHERHPEVRSQLASTAKRLPGPDAVPIIRNLLRNAGDMDDPDIPLLIWWAVESKSESDRAALLTLFRDPAVWNNAVVREVVLKRLMQRYIMAGGKDNYDAATRLLKLSPSMKLSRLLVAGLQEGLVDKDITELPPDLISLLKPFHAVFGEAPLILPLRMGEPKAVKEALGVIADDKAELGYRLAYVRLMGETERPDAVPVLLRLVESGQTPGTLRAAALWALSGYNLPEIGSRIIKAYPVFHADYYDRLAALNVLATRAEWARGLLTEIVKTRKISPKEIPDEIVHRLKLLGEQDINDAVEKLWPDARPLTSSEKAGTMSRVSKLIRSAPGDTTKGHTLFLSTCATCHRLNGEGGNIGPDLSGYDRHDLQTLLINIVDPNADIREGFEVQRIIMADGRTLEGRIVSRSGKSVTIRPPLGGEQMVLSADKIREIRPRLTSTMPERLLDKMPDRDVRDIFAYIMKMN
ncbi:HEAT repeat domain-containing protein [Compostibacter hankyongensis]|uniref:HEAT repeat domain-containing protein n=2 Tax=Compostibacter hankyongensis TaxID=1007089 RepID=A0ABP8FMT1_9BACT